MKKLIISVLILALLLFSCNSFQERREQITLPIKITAKLKGGEGYFIADITESKCEISFEEGHALYGTVLYFDQDEGEAIIGEYKRKVDINIFPAQAALIKALRALGTGNISGVETEDGVKYTIDEMTIMVYYDEDGEEIIGIGTEEDGRQFNFVIADAEPYEA